jgi:hypothetical protein
VPKASSFKFQPEEIPICNAPVLLFSIEFAWALMKRRYKKEVLRHQLHHMGRPEFEEMVLRIAQRVGDDSGANVFRANWDYLRDCIAEKAESMTVPDLQHGEPQCMKGDSRDLR